MTNGDRQCYQSGSLAIAFVIGRLLVSVDCHCLAFASALPAVTGLPREPRPAAERAATGATAASEALQPSMRSGMRRAWVVPGFARRGSASERQVHSHNTQPGWQQSQCPLIEFIAIEFLAGHLIAHIVAAVNWQVIVHPHVPHTNLLPGNHQTLGTKHKWHVPGVGTDAGTFKSDMLYANIKWVAVALLAGLRPGSCWGSCDWGGCADILDTRPGRRPDGATGFL